jgi:mRNA interferase MazF
LILTRQSTIPYLTGITVAPVTTTIRNIPTEVYLTPFDDGTPEECAVNCDNIQTVRKAAIGRVITTLTPDRLIEVERALCFALGFDRLLS